MARAFILSHVDGLKYREIAVELDVSERTVKKYLAQAMLHCALLEAAHHAATQPAHLPPAGQHAPAAAC